MTTTVQDRARTLYASGYRCELTPAGLIVTTPANRQYRVSADGCTCPASVQCKHHMGRAGLAWSQADALTDEANALDCAIVSAHTVADRHGCRLTRTGLDLRRQVLALEKAAGRLRTWAEAAAGGAVAVEGLLARAAGEGQRRAA